MTPSAAMAPSDAAHTTWRGASWRKSPAAHKPGVGSIQDEPAQGGELCNQCKEQGQHLSASLEF